MEDDLQWKTTFDGRQYRYLKNEDEIINEDDQLGCWPQIWLCAGESLVVVPGGSDEGLVCMPCPEIRIWKV